MNASSLKLQARKVEYAGQKKITADSSNKLNINNYNH